MKSVSQGEVRAALVDFLSTATSLLKTIKPLIDASIQGELRKLPPVESTPKAVKTTAKSGIQTYENEDQVPL